MLRPKVSLKALEVFLAVARRGVLSDAAGDLEISISTASHHLAEMERSAGTALFDHSTRPMALTTAGEIMRRRVKEALGSLQMGFSEIWSDDLTTLTRPVRLAVIEDFDADVTPVLAERLVRAMPHCELSVMSRPTHEILDLLANHQIDLGVATSAKEKMVEVSEVPLLHDPFVLLLPAQADLAPESLKDLAPGPDLPFLRYSARQMLGQRIEAQLRRAGLNPPHRMEFETTHVILSLVAAGRGWTITTALSFARAQRYHSQLRVLPVLGAEFERGISVFAQADVPRSLVSRTVDTLRASAAQLAIGPVVARYPWLKERFRMADALGDAGNPNY